MTALATTSDMLKRVDARELGDLCGDAGVTVTPDELIDHPNLEAALDDAWGEILAVLRVSERYAEADLTDLDRKSTRLNSSH